MTDNNLLTRQQAAEYLGVTKQWLDVLATRHAGPPFFKIASRAVRYDPADLKQWLDARKVIH